MRHAPSLPDAGMWGYGYHWWVGRLSSGQPVVAAMGNGNQRLYLLPEQKIGITLLAGQYNQKVKRSNELLMRVVSALKRKR